MAFARGAVRPLPVLLVLGMLAAVAGMSTWWLLEPPVSNVSTPAAPAPADVVALGARRPAFRLVDLEGRMRDVAEWDGKLLIVNFWATWCPPCRKEIPAFIELQAEYAERGVQFVGIAIDDGEAVADYAGARGINYPVLLGQADAIELSRRFGNGHGGLPFTVFVGRNGLLLYRKPGELSRDAAETLIRAHL